ncbi:PTS transporter subunit EIIC [Clostridium sp. LP20]|uniref:PTS transporter subunit EIIC n=1 Tax=Clostridium sp. LP20 TaxID=3418665 RepID=UPI003EE77524
MADLITSLIQAPIQSVSDSLGSAIIIPLIVCTLWSFGIHGTNVTDGIFVPILTALAAENMELSAQGTTSGLHIVNGPFFYAFVWIGGAGTTLGLIIAMLIAGKRSRNRYGAITTLSIGPGIFNINEPVIFGVPIVLNPVMVIPFILVPVTLSTNSYFAISIELVSPVVVQSIPWTTPPILSGFLATGSLSGAILGLFNLILSAILYTPFVLTSLKTEEKTVK